MSIFGLHLLNHKSAPEQWAVLLLAENVKVCQALVSTVAVRQRPQGVAVATETRPLRALRLGMNLSFVSSSRFMDEDLSPDFSDIHNIGDV